MRVVLIVSTLLVIAGASAAGPAEDTQAAYAAYRRGDYAAAMKLFRRAADEGNGEAANNIGAMYFSGQGVPYDDVEAAKWFRRAAELGDANAQRNLGNSYRGGQGVPRDDVLALVWFNLAIDSGHPKAAEDRDIVLRVLTPAQIAEAQKLTDEWKQKHRRIQ